MKKGAGTTISSVLIIIVLLFFLYIFIATSANSSQKRLELNLNTIDFLKVKNTLSILNRSLSTTWFVSTVQMIFKAGDESIGCGYDDYFDVDIGLDVTKGGYWYQYSDTTKKREPNPLPTPGNKYNMKPKAGGFKDIINPRICYPTEQHFTDFVARNFMPYKEILKEFTINGIEFSLDKIMLAQIKLDDDRAISSVSQEIKANAARSNPFILTTTTNVNTIFTGFKQMMSGGRKIVDAAIAISESLNPDPLKSGQRATSEFLYTPATLAENYKRDAKKKIEAKFQSALPKDKFRIDVEYKPDGDIELRASDENEIGLGFQLNKHGLIMHYDAGIKISELGDVSSSGPGCDVTPFSQSIENAVGTWKFKDTDFRSGLIPWVTTTFEYSKDEIKALVSAVVQAESSAIPGENTCNPQSKSCAGAVGLMQLIPGTARNQGLNVPDYGEETLKCLGVITEQEDNKCNSITPAICRPLEDDRFDAQKNIQGGTKYLQFLFNKLSEYTRDRDELIKLVASSYNAGENVVITAIEKASKNDGVDKNNVKFSDIDEEGYLLKQTRDYVRKVMGFYVANGGSISSSSYYYHDEENNRFTPRPFELDMSVEDNLNVLDCIIDTSGSTQPFTLYRWTTDRDMACCGGALWTCNANPAVQNIGNHALLLGQTVLAQDDALPNDPKPSRVCANAVSLSKPNNAGLQYTLGCTADGFTVVSYVP